MDYVSIENEGYQKKATAGLRSIHPSEIHPFARDRAKLQWSKPGVWRCACVLHAYLDSGSPTFKSLIR